VWLLGEAAKAAAASLTMSLKIAAHFDTILQALPWISGEVIVLRLVCHRGVVKEVADLVHTFESILKLIIVQNKFSQQVYR